MDFSELRQMGEELIAMGSQEVNNRHDEQQQDPSSSSVAITDVSNETKNETNQTNDAFHNYSSLTFPSSYRNVEPSIASTSYSSAIDDPLASAASHPSTSQHTYFNASELLGINSLYKNNLGLQFPGEFTSPPVMEDIAEGDEGAMEKLVDEPVLHFHQDSRETSTSSVMKDSEVSQLLSQQLDCWNFNGGSKHDSSDWNMNLNGEQFDTLPDSSFQPTVNMLKQVDQRENFDTSSLYFSTYGSDYAPSIDNLDTQQFFPNPQQPLVSITSSSAATSSAVNSSSNSNTKVSTEKRFQPTKHRVARKELRTLPAKLEKAKKKKQQKEQQQKQLMLQNQSTSTTTTSNVLQMPNLPSNTMSSFNNTFTCPTSASASSANSYSAQSNSQQSLPKQSHSSSPRLKNQSPMEQELLQPSDMTETTRLIFTAFAQTKFVYYDSADDKRAKRSSVPDGFVGFACKHCEGKSKCAADLNNSSKKKPKFARCGRYFPSNIKTFADRSKTLNALVKHLIKCPSVPLETRNNLILFEQSHDEETKMKRLLNASYTQKDIFKTMWNRLHPGAED
ncbi:hypothetical protein CTEN210_11835 [Chaetoceros tenuissimus]|uniref:Uncharacterized protein n=1 Tax=Chaetoceros tenuissimus TaxID=426638 RepID=A0AAD3D0F2_9STRA|nr:hypothetical protein CTEN210_11835 [Chaetoceros tenuissimus]